MDIHHLHRLGFSQRRIAIKLGICRPTVRKYLDNPDLVTDRKMSSAKEVADYGYRAMMKGKPVAIQGFKNSLMANAVRFFPRGFIVKMVRKIQVGKHFKEIQVS